MLKYNYCCCSLIFYIFKKKNHKKAKLFFVIKMPNYSYLHLISLFSEDSVKHVFDRFLKYLFSSVYDSWSDKFVELSK